MDASDEVLRRRSAVQHIDQGSGKGRRTSSSRAQWLFLRSFATFFSVDLGEAWWEGVESDRRCRFPTEAWHRAREGRVAMMAAGWE